jgi:hypothetical protein
MYIGLHLKYSLFSIILANLNFLNRVFIKFNCQFSWKSSLWEPFYCLHEHRRTDGQRNRHDEDNNRIFFTILQRRLKIHNFLQKQQTKYKAFKIPTCYYKELKLLCLQNFVAVCCTKRREGNLEERSSILANSCLGETKNKRVLSVRSMYAPQQMACDNRWHSFINVATKHVFFSQRETTAVWA